MTISSINLQGTKEIVSISQPSGSLFSQIKHNFESISAFFKPTSGLKALKFTHSAQDMSPKAYFEFYADQFNYIFSKALQDKFNTDSTWDEAFEAVVNLIEAFDEVAKEGNSIPSATPEGFKLSLMRQIIVGHIFRYGSKTPERYHDEPGLFII